MNKKQLKDAFADGLIDVDKYKDESFKLDMAPKVKKQAKRLPVALSEEEFRQLLVKTKKPVFRVAFLLGYGAGLRLSEIVGGIREDGSEIKPLSKEKIDIENRTMLIEGAKGRVDRVVPLPKGFKPSMLSFLPISKIYSNCASARRSLQRGFKVAARKAKLLEIKPTLHFHCVSADTEILTEDGWKNYKELKKGKTKVFSWNIKNNKIDLGELKDITTYNLDGKLHNIKNQYFDMLITGEHKVPIRFSQRKNDGKNENQRDEWNDWSLMEFQEFLNTKNKRCIQHKIAGEGNGKLSIGKAKAALLGWILSDGHIAKKDGDVTISQCLSANKKKCDYIESLLKKSKLKYMKNIQKQKISDFNKRLYRMVIFRISKKDTSWIYDWINKDRTPKYKILQLKNDELNEVYKSLMLGDGSRGNEYCSQNKERIEFLRCLCVLIGKRTFLGTGKIYPTNKDKFRTYIFNRDYGNIRMPQIKEVKYKGIVWCPTTEHGTFIAKRNTTIFITGNSLRHGFGTRLAGQGVPIHHIRTMMGHANISTTNVYLESNPKEALKSYEDLF